MLLGVNVDHVATIRQARGTDYPDPVEAALEAQVAGAELITVHLREDRRHIQDRDVKKLKQVLGCRLNLEMAITDEMIAIACELKPSDCCLVPEKREELTTEGGLDVLGQQARVSDAVEKLSKAGIRVSLFVDPDIDQLNAAKAAGAMAVELHTGRYAEAGFEEVIRTELNEIRKAVEYARSLGLQVNAGHGLHYENVQPIAAIEGIEELNIGHAIVARSVFTGIRNAVTEMKKLCQPG